jgi:hypothetical protein
VVLDLLETPGMRTFSILCTFVLSNLLPACGDNVAGPVEPPADGSPSASTIRISVDAAPALVAFRDGLDAPWQPVTMTTPTSFEIEVHGPYVVTVVCEDLATGRSKTLQVAGTPDDANTFKQLSCGLTAPSEPQSEHAITGHMVQAGYVHLGSSSDTSEDANWDFQLSAADGTYDLIAVTTDRIAVRRDIAVTADLAVTPDVDVAAEASPLVDIAFYIDNAAQGENLTLSVDLVADGQSPAQVYHGPPDIAKVVPSALVTTEKQVITLQATSGVSLRSLQRPFLVHDETQYTLPIAISGVQWTIDQGQLSTSWTALPPLDVLDISVTRPATDDTASADHNLRVTPAFVGETGITHIAIDTDIPGYKPEWRIDFNDSYARSITASHKTDDQLNTSSVTENVNVPAPDDHPTSRSFGAYNLR